MDKNKLIFLCTLFVFISASLFSQPPEGFKNKIYGKPGTEATGYSYDPKAIDLIGSPLINHYYQGVGYLTAINMTSYFRDTKDPARYYMYSMFDGDPKTAWLEGVKGNGIGESVGAQFVQSIAVDKIEIMPGFFDQQWYVGNNRIKKARIELEVMYNLFNGKPIPATYLPHSYDVIFPDKMEKFILLDSPVQLGSFKLTILEVYPSISDDDTAISELIFSSKGKPYDFIRSKKTIPTEEKIYYYLAAGKSFANHNMPGMGGSEEYYFSADGTFYILTSPSFGSISDENMLTGGYWSSNPKDSTISLLFTEKVPTQGGKKLKIIRTQTFYIFDFIVHELYWESLYGGWGRQRWDIKSDVFNDLSKGNSELARKLWQSEP